LPERPSSACSSSTLRGDLRTSAPGAYLPAVSASGTCAYRRAARAARRPDLMDKPSLQTSQVIAGTCRTATPAPLYGARYARCPRFPQGRTDAPQFRTATGELLAISVLELKPECSNTFKRGCRRPLAAEAANVRVGSSTTCRRSGRDDKDSRPIPTEATTASALKEGEQI